MRFNLIFLMGILLAACSTPSQMKTTIKSIDFGEGGGLTGMVKQYTLDIAKGTLQKQGGEEAVLTQAETDKVVQLVLANDLYNISQHQPYNYYKFLTIDFEDKKQENVWGDPSVSTPEELIEVHTYLMTLVKKYL